MTKKITAKLLEAMTNEDFAEIDRILSVSANIDDQFKGGLLGWATTTNIAHHLIKRNCKLDQVHPVEGTPLKKAVVAENVELVRLLLESGARVELDEKSLVITAAKTKLEIVKLLVEAGANLHEEYYASALDCQMNPLSLACAHGKEDIAEYLRSQGAVMPGEGEFTMPTRVLTELVPTDPPIDIHLHPPTSEHSWVRLMTGGLSHYQAPIPTDSDDCPFAELRIDLPSEWKIDSIDDPVFGWPIHWLRIMAKQITRLNMTLGKTTIFPNPENNGAIAPNSEMTCMLLSAIETMEFQGKTIQVYQVLPLYEDEREFAERETADDLFEALSNRPGVEYPMVVDVTRNSVVKN